MNVGSISTSQRSRSVAESGHTTLLLYWFAVCLLLAACTSPAERVPAAADLPTDFAREELQRRIAGLQKIASPNGIDTLEELQIDGSRQWLSIRGLSRDNPVLLMIHGGPGVPTMPMRWAFQRPLEDFFTVVQWDQRGVGKNHATADHEALDATMTVERHVDDAIAVVAHLRERFGKEKIFVLGFSWGSHVGLLLAQRQPEWLHAYAGVGQSAPDGASPEFPSVEGHIFDRLRELATAEGNDAALAELEAIAPYPALEGETDIEDVLVVRKWARFYNGGWYGHRDFDLLWQLNDWSPEYTDADVEGFFVGGRWAGERLVADLTDSTINDFDGPFSTPIFFLMGRHDLHTPYEPAKAFLERLDAPQKKFITFEHSAHFPMFAQQGRFTRTLVDEFYGVLGREP